MTSATRALQAADADRLELDALVAALSARFTVVTGPKQLISRGQLDTFDRRLRAAGLRLERQQVAAGELLVLRTRGEAQTVMVPVTGLRLPALVDALPVGPIREAIAPVIDIRALVVTSEERRRVRRLDLENDDGKTVARVELDEPASAAAAPARVSVRALRGYEDQARRAARLLEDLGLYAVGDSEDDQPSSAETMSPTDRGVPARLLLTMALDGFFRALRENLPGLLDDIDTEFLHDFRVGVRRTRTTLKLPSRGWVT
jgi:hypothetical protein